MEPSYSEEIRNVTYKHDNLYKNREVKFIPNLIKKQRKINNESFLEKINVSNRTKENINYDDNDDYKTKNNQMRNFDDLDEEHSVKSNNKLSHKNNDNISYSNYTEHEESEVNNDLSTSNVNKYENFKFESQNFRNNNKKLYRSYKNTNHINSIKNELDISDCEEGDRGMNDKITYEDKPESAQEYIYGVHPVVLALKSSRREVLKLYIRYKTAFDNDLLLEAVNHCRQMKIPIAYSTTHQINCLIGGPKVHQGVCLKTKSIPPINLDFNDIVKENSKELSEDNIKILNQDNSKIYSESNIKIVDEDNSKVPGEENISDPSLQKT